MRAEFLRFSSLSFLVVCAACASSSSSSDPPGQTPPPGADPPAQPPAVTCAKSGGPSETLVTESGYFVSTFAIDDTHAYYLIETMDGSPTESILRRVPLAGGASEEIAKSKRGLSIAVTKD